MFGSRGTSDHVFRIGEAVVEEDTEYRYLGIWFDQSGTFAKSKRVMVARTTQALVLSTTQLTRKACFSVKALTSVWKTLIRPHGIWSGGTGRT